MTATKTARKPSRAATPQRRGEDYLSGLEAISVKLENGQTVTLDRKEELSTPDGVLPLRRAAREAPARYAFWAYQADRALAVVRRQEVELAKLEGETYLVYREWYQEHTDEDYISNDMIQARVASDNTVVSKRQQLSRARKQYNLLRSMRDAQDHRCHILRRLIAQSAAEATESL